jgi:hypothetical protein
MSRMFWKAVQSYVTSMTPRVPPDPISGRRGCAVAGSGAWNKDFVDNSEGACAGMGVFHNVIENSPSLVCVKAPERVLHDRVAPIGLFLESGTPGANDTPPSHVVAADRSPGWSEDRAEPWVRHAVKSLNPRRGWHRSNLFAILMAVAIAPHTFAGPNRHATDANVLYETGQVQDALDIYNGLAEERPDNAALKFNQGAAQYKLGDLESAVSAFESAAELSDNPKLQALASYNLGNCATQKAQAQAAEDPEEAVKTLFQGVRHYKNALAKNAGLGEAANNLEMTKRAIQQLREQMKQQQEQQQQQQQQNQQQQDGAKKELDELIQEQQSQNQESQEAAGQKKDPGQPNPTQQQMNDQADQQEETRERTEEAAESMDDGREEPSPMDEAKEHAEKAVEKQKEAEEHLRDQDPEKANEAQEEALEELKKARESLDEEGEKRKQDNSPEGEQSNEGEKSQENQPEDEQEGKPQERPGEDMKDVPAPDADARDILNQEKEQKKARRARQMIGVRPVEKDW